MIFNPMPSPFWILQRSGRPSLILSLVVKTHLSKRSSNVWWQGDYFPAFVRVRVSHILNRKYKTFHFFFPFS